MKDMEIDLQVHSIYCTQFFIVCEQFYKLIHGTLISEKLRISVYVHWNNGMIFKILWNQSSYSKGSLVQ